MIERVKANGLEFELVACDCLYGRSTEFRGRLRDADLTYMAEVPCDTQVYLQPPVLGMPNSQSPRGRQPSKVRVLSEEPAVRVEACPRNRLATTVRTGHRTGRVAGSIRGATGLDRGRRLCG
jgi:SRSO17 transposase